MSVRNRLERMGDEECRGSSLRWREQEKDIGRAEKDGPKE